MFRPSRGAILKGAKRIFKLDFAPAGIRASDELRNWIDGRLI
jgi:hypothetical protein